MTVKLLTKEIEKEFEKTGCQDGKGFGAICIARFFHPLTSWTWYATEYFPQDKIFFGYVCGDFNEWGDFSLEEMEEAEVERDLYFTKKTLSEVLKKDGNKQNF
jgi:hypothetical protein